MKDLEQLENSLIKLKDNLFKELEASNYDQKSFHNRLFQLIKEYPEYKDILEFIVYVNDTNQTNIETQKDIIERYFNEIIERKLQLTKKVKEFHKSPTGYKKYIKKDYIIIAVISLLVFSGGVYFYDHETGSKLIEIVVKLFKGLL